MTFDRYYEIHGDGPPLVTERRDDCLGAIADFLKK
jgi:hypothetical protein